ncbi:DUF4384 domain-containing protein [Variovorax ureilyticus]|uniref:DUF4384 domain-containing protein n=1 Tax=Variovorax ureilyticus TaxID=1836198 RepID=A0ABU8VA50_9BURK
MKPPRIVRLLALAAIAALAGCQALEVKQPTIEQTAEIRVGPEQKPQRSITGFSQPLRCMDTLMLDYGVRDVTMLTEEITDETKKLNAGTRDMLISAVSDMSRRSRAVRLVAFGKDTLNVVSFLSAAQTTAVYQAIPRYDIKGSVSQFDENLIKNQKDLGIGYFPYLNLGVAKDASTSMLALDLSVMSTSDMGVLPGVTSRNAVVIMKQGKGFDGDAAYRKFGINYSMNLARSEGQSQALRGLVELAVVELIGKLTKTPYWSCLGVTDPKSNEETRLEMLDWYSAMATSRIELIAYFQNQLRHRGFYDGPIDGEFNPAIDEAISNYREQLGLSRAAVLDEKFFSAFLAADHSKVQRPAQPARYVAPGTPGTAATTTGSQTAAATAPASAPAPTAAPLKLSVSAPSQQTRFARGESISLSLAPSQDAHVYCYLRDEEAKVIRFFPNRFTRDSRISSAKPLTLPGSMRFQLSMNAKGVPETVTCFATPRDVMPSLPQAVVGIDFEPLPGVTLETIRVAFDKASGGTLAQENFHVQAK